MGRKLVGAAMTLTTIAAIAGCQKSDSAASAPDSAQMAQHGVSGHPMQPVPNPLAKPSQVGAKAGAGS
jgi:hypothetical protein